MKNKKITFVLCALKHASFRAMLRPCFTVLMSCPVPVLHCVHAVPVPCRGLQNDGPTLSALVFVSCRANAKCVVPEPCSCQPGPFNTSM